MDAADAGDTIRVKRGVYREAVRVNGRRKRYLKLIGNPRRPGRVVLEGSGRKQNGGSRSTSPTRWRSTASRRATTAPTGSSSRPQRLHDEPSGRGEDRRRRPVRLHTIGGRILNSEAYYVNDGAFYIGQTPPQVNPVRRIVRNVEGCGSPIGFSAANMRYVTITKSRFYNNAVGIVPNALASEKFPPPEDNAIVDNDIFWNNLNFHEGDPPFEPREEGTGALAPIGSGDPAARRPRPPDRRQPDLRQLPHGDRGDRRDPAPGGLAGDLARSQRDPRQRVRARRDRHERPAT